MTAKPGKIRAFQGGKTIKPGGIYWMRYVLPALAFYVVFMAYPMLDSVRLSLYEGTAGVREYVGLANYVRLFTDEVVSKRFWNAFRNNWIFFAYHMILQNALGITFAAILTNRTMRGRTALPIPAFNEYVRCFPDCEIVPLESAAHDFRFDMDELRAAAESCDNLLIIDPDNPSGAFLRREDLLELAALCREHGTRLVVDESFVDFAEPELRFTLLDNEILEEYPNLLVMKSISKSYGVPGLRLGVCAGADRAWMASLRGLLPVWNINSFAEYFLQIFGLYASQYGAACDEIVRQREKMTERLAAFPFLHPYPSQANYILCRVEGMTSRELADRLLAEDILIKDLSEKTGFRGGSFVRIAVRDESDNRALYDALAGIRP